MQLIKVLLHCVRFTETWESGESVNALDITSISSNLSISLKGHRWSTQTPNTRITINSDIIPHTHEWGDITAHHTPDSLLSLWILTYIISQTAAPLSHTYTEGVLCSQTPCRDPNATASTPSLALTSALDITGLPPKPHHHTSALSSSAEAVLSWRSEAAARL